MDTRRYGNYQFHWTNLHLPRVHTGPLRFQYDYLGSEAVECLRDIAKHGPSPGERLDLLQLLQNHHTENATLTTLWTELHTVPQWVDWEQLARGQKFFYRYAAANIMGFALQGFVGENSAASGVVEVLVRTGGFSTRVLLRRLLETFQMILQVTGSIEAIKPGGAGHATAIRVRLLHASVRNRIMKLAKTKAEYFDIDKFGVPINTLDSIHSITTFCCNHMWLQLPQQGVFPNQQEKEDYIALWRYVGHLLGTPHQYFESAAHARAVMESMLIHELEITPTSLVVGHNFVECLKDWPPFNISAQFIEAGSRALNGDEVCDSLGFKKPGLYSYACWRGHCWLVRGLALAQQTFPAVDRAVTDWWRTLLHWAVIEKGLSGGSTLGFQYIPELGQITGKENNGRKPLSLSPLRRPVEAFYISVFVLGCAGMLAMAWLSISLTFYLLHI